LRHLILSFCLLLSACVAPAVLEPPPTAIPAGIDLTGYWTLRQIENRDRQAPQPEELIIPRAQRATIDRSRKSLPGSAARVFLESGKQLKVTQAESALFVSFDRSVVEEYRFGVLREVSVGPIKAQRSAGWVGDRLVVKTLDEDGALLTETWRLQDQGSALVRQIELMHKDRLLMSATQLFDRTRR
jgi:hypothetical protein